MNKKYLNQFIQQIEVLARTCGSDELVGDEAGAYPKASYLDHVISDAKELIKYGEHRIALENILDNLQEVSIILDKRTYELARKAFGERDGLYPCPCCGLRTLTERFDPTQGTGYDICPYCKWEDDGTTEKDAETYRAINRGSMSDYRKRLHHCFTGGLKWEKQWEQHLKKVADSYDNAIELGRKGIDQYKDLPESITKSPDYRKWLEDSLHSGSECDKIKEYLQPDRKLNFIDLGCCLNLMFRGYDKWPSTYYGLDISSKTIALLSEFADKRQLSIGGLHCGSIHETPFETDFFDLGACIGVLEYYTGEFVEMALAEMNRILKPGAKLVLDIPDSGNSAGRTAMMIEEHLGRPDLFDLSSHEFETMLQRYFEVKDTERGGMIVYYLKCKK